MPTRKASVRVLILIASVGILAPVAASACLLQAGTSLEQYTAAARRTQVIAWVATMAGTGVALWRGRRSRHAPRLVPFVCAVTTIVHPVWTVPVSLDASCQVHGDGAAIAAALLVFLAIAWQGWRDALDLALVRRT